MFIPLFLLMTLKQLVLSPDTKTEHSVKFVTLLLTGVLQSTQWALIPMKLLAENLLARVAVSYLTVHISTAKLISMV